jgi:hypothetical protein
MCAEHYRQQQRPSDLVIFIKGATQRKVRADRWEARAYPPNNFADKLLFS